MDWDEVSAKTSRSAGIGDNLETLSVAELEERIGAFEIEIERIRAELARKRAHESAAEALFKTSKT